MNFLIILLGKLLSSFIRLLNLGNGSTWPGHIALLLNDNFIEQTLNKSKIKKVVIIGTNGKTTTSKLIRTIFKTNNSKSVYNMSGANLLNGIASSIIISSKFDGKLKKDFAVFEIDENAFPKVCEKIKPDFVIALNLFRDQLDRYGEIDTISANWKKAIDGLKDTTLILNADDPQIAFLGKGLKKNVYYFGLEDKKLENGLMQHGADSILCPSCATSLKFSSYYFSHLGKWKCPNCNLERPKPNLSKLSYYPLKGTYALYDILAAVLFAQVAGINKDVITKALKDFKPAFGRQETISYMEKDVQIFLSKNPISFNESLSTVKSLGGKNLIIILNDQIPDGLDVSWIWDIDFENILTKDMNILVTGERMFDMATRLKYAGFFAHVAKDIKQSIDKMVENLNDDEKLYILPNYSAMLEVRQILTGKKIL